MKIYRVINTPACSFVMEEQVKVREEKGFSSFVFLVWVAPIIGTILHGILK